MTYSTQRVRNSILHEDTARSNVGVYLRITGGFRVAGQSRQPVVCATSLRINVSRLSLVHSA